GSTTSSASAVAVATVPGAPTNAIATAGNGNATIAFSPPGSNGGSAITSFAATCSAGAVNQTASGAASPLTVTPLANGVTYSCTVSATNAVGTGPASAAASVTPLSSIGTPSAPTIQTASGANTSAVIIFQTPASPG